MMTMRLLVLVLMLLACSVTVVVSTREEEAEHTMRRQQHQLQKDADNLRKIIQGDHEDQQDMAAKVANAMKKLHTGDTDKVVNMDPMAKGRLERAAERMREHLEGEREAINSAMRPDAFVKLREALQRQQQQQHDEL